MKHDTQHKPYNEGSVASGKETWNPGRVDHSDPCKKYPTGYLPANQSKSGVKSGTK